MPRQHEAASWIDQALDALSGPEDTTKAELGVAVNRIETAIEQLGDNPAPDEYEALTAELGHSNPDIERCRESLMAIRDRVKTK